MARRIDLHVRGPCGSSRPTPAAAVFFPVARRRFDAENFRWDFREELSGNVMGRKKAGDESTLVNPRIAAGSKEGRRT